MDVSRFWYIKIKDNKVTNHQLTSQNQELNHGDLSDSKKKYQDTWDVYSWAAIVVSNSLSKYPSSDEDLLELIPKLKKLVPLKVFKIIKSCLDENPEKRPTNVIELKKLLKNEIPIKFH